MKKQIRWHYLLLAIAIAIGLVIAFWSRSLREPQVDDVPGGSEAARDTRASVSAPSGMVEHPTVQTAAATSPDEDDQVASLLDQQAMNAWQQGEIPEAMALFEQAIAADPDNPAPHANYGRLLTLMVAYQDALPLLERARDLQPDDAQAWLDLATLYERAQAFEDSWQAHEQAARLVGADAITRDEKGRFVIEGTQL